jgi:hypothetical protein
MRFVYFGFGAAFVLVVGLVVFAMLPDASEWREVVAGEGAWHVTVSKDGGFECLFPSKPELVVRENSEERTWKDVPHRLFTAVYWADLPPGADLEDRREAENLLEKFAKIFEWESNDGRVVSARNFQLDDGSPARETVFHSPKNGYRRSRIILRQGRVYEISMAGAQDFVEGKDAETFFGAFRFLDGPSASGRKIALFPAGSRVDAEVRTVAHTEARTTEVEHGFPMVSKASGIACTFPSAPKGERLEDGETYTWTAEGGGRTLEIMSKRSELFDPQNGEQMKRVFADFQRSFQKGFEWSRVISSRDFMLAPDVACHDLVLEVPDSRRFRMRVLLTRDRAHMVTALGPEEFVLGDETGAFFESVRILDKTPPDVPKIASSPGGITPVAGERTMENAGADSPPGTADRADWYPSASKEAGIACRFPSEPNVYVDDLAEVHRWSNARGDRILLMNRLKSAKPQPLTDDAMFDGFEERSLREFPGAQVISSTNFQFAGRYQARDVVLRIPDRGLWHFWCILKQDRVCTLVAAGPTEFVEGEDAATFFQSFHFLDDGE